MKDISKIPWNRPIIFGWCYEEYSIQQGETAQNLMAKKQTGNHATEDTANC
jgi:hypothetical protein